MSGTLTAEATELTNKARLTATATTLLLPHVKPGSPTEPLLVCARCGTEGTDTVRGDSASPEGMGRYSWEPWLC